MRYLIVALLLFLLIPAVAARNGIGISPGCIGADPQGKCIFLNVKLNQTLEYEYHVYNFDDVERAFKVSAEGNLSPHITVESEEFTLQQHSGKDCKSSPGCEVVMVKINNSNIEPGIYTTEIAASTSALSGGMLALNQIVKARLLLNISEPPKTSIKEKVKEKLASLTERQMPVENKTESPVEDKESNGLLDSVLIVLLVLAIIFAAAKIFKKPKESKKTEKKKSKEAKKKKQKKNEE
jgi:hypothetical protein